MQILKKLANYIKIHVSVFIFIFQTLPTDIDPSSPMTEACKSESKKKNRYNIKPCKQIVNK